MNLDKMKKIFNRNFIVALFICLGFLLIYRAGFFGVGKNDKNSTNQNANSNNGQAELKQAETLPAGIWTVDSSEDYRALGYSGQRKIVADGKSGFYLAYRKKNNGRYQIFVAHASLKEKKYIFDYTDRPIKAVTAGDDQRVPSLAVDASGVLHAVWYGVDGNRPTNERQIKYSRSLDQGETWSEWKNIALVTGFRFTDEYWQEHPAITAVGGKVWVVWEGRDVENVKQQIKMTISYDDGETWSDWKNIKVTPTNTQSRPTLLTQNGRDLHLLMYSSWGNALNLQQIQYSSSSDGGENWSDWLNISDPERDSRHLSACLTESGRIYVAWRSFSPQLNKSRLESTYLIGRSWRNPQSVSESAENQMFPSIACGTKEEKFALTWMESAEPALLPREDPFSGRVMLSFFDGQQFSAATKIGGEGEGNYPNLPEVFDQKQLLPIFFAEKQPDGLNGLKFGLLEKR